MFSVDFLTELDTVSLFNSQLSWDLNPFSVQCVNVLQLKLFHGLMINNAEQLNRKRREGKVDSVLI